MKDKNKTVIWIKIGTHFIDQDNIRGIVRHGNGTIIQLNTGSDIEVNVAYEKIKALLPVDRYKI